MSDKPPISIRYAGDGPELITRDLTDDEKKKAKEIFRSGVLDGGKIRDEMNI